MTEMAPEPNPVTAVARDLTAIEDMATRLLTQAVNQGDHHDMPGGAAMVALGPVASMEAWENLNEATERYGRGYTAAELEDPERSWPPFQLLRYWSEAWRVQHDADYLDRPTIATEANFLRHLLGWAWDNLDPKEWDKVASDIKTARRRLENILTEGSRDIISDEVSCLMCQTHLRRRMTRAAGYEDEWWCRECRVHLTTAQFNLAASEAARLTLGLVDPINDVG